MAVQDPLLRNFRDSCALGHVPFLEFVLGSDQKMAILAPCEDGEILDDYTCLEGSWVFDGTLVVPPGTSSSLTESPKFPGDQSLTYVQGASLNITLGGVVVGGSIEVGVN